MKTVLINGSPKKKLSVSSYLLEMVHLAIRGKVMTEQIRNAKDHERVLESIKYADTVVFCLPLYVDGVPSHILAFLKDMEKCCTHNKICMNVYVVSNGGFIEGSQNRPLMQVFENFCKRCNLRWCGGIGIGGGVMLNVLRILFFVFAGMFAWNSFMFGLSAAFPVFAQQVLVILVLSLGVIFYCLRLGVAINRGSACGVKFTRILLPSFLFILIADIFFVITSVFQGGIFRGWLKRK